VQQLYKICTQYWDDKYNTESVSEEVTRENHFLMLKVNSYSQFHSALDANGMP
jgi:myosin-5